MVPQRENRPSTANTMLLVLKPRPVDFSSNSTLFMGSENEREACRKNRVMQMKLRAYMTDVHQQQQSSARLLKTEEYRFLQEATRRSGVPKSVNMLDQLHFYRDKTFPGRRFSTDWHFRDGHHPHHHKHPPLSARPMRSQRQVPLLNRPKTSATLYRKNINEEEVQIDQTDNYISPTTELNTNYDILIDSSGRHVATVTTEQKINQNITLAQEQDYRQTTELPPIRLKDIKENVQPLDNFKDNPINMPRDIQASAQSKLDMDKDIRNIPFGIERATKIEDVASPCVKNLNYANPLRQRQESSGSLRASLDNKSVTLARMDSFIECAPQTELDKDVNNNSLPEQIDNNMLGPVLTDGDIEKELKNMRVNEFLTKHAIQDLQKHQQYQQQQLDNDTSLSVSLQFTDGKPMESTDERQDQRILSDPTEAVEDSSEVKHQKRLIRQNTKTNFNRVVNQPAPLRHNITSVLRQERTKYEASQKKVKDYLHTMGSKDTLSRHSNNVSREQSAHTRRSAVRKDSDAKSLRKSMEA